MRANYWSCSPLANKIRGVDKPPYASLEEWNVWNKTAREAYPIRYWLAEDGLDIIQDWVYFYPDLIDNVTYYIKNRWITKSHCLVAAPSNIKPGSWCDFSDRIFYCLFDELVNFVEIEKASMERFCVYSDGDSKTKPKRSWFSRLKPSRNPSDGLKFLTWESNLKYEDTGDDSLDGEYTEQAKNAQWIISAYLWYTVTRPARPDPSDASGWSQYCDSKREETGDLFLASVSNEDRELSSAILDKMHKMEKDYDDEDTKWLKELIDHRDSFWT